MMMIVYDSHILHSIFIFPFFGVLIIIIIILISW